MKYTLRMSGPAVRVIRGAVPKKVREFFRTKDIPLSDVGGEEYAFEFFENIPHEYWPFEPGWPMGEPEHDFVAKGVFQGPIMGRGGLSLEVCDESGGTVFRAEGKALDALATVRWGEDEDTAVLRGGENGGILSWHAPGDRDTPEKEESSLNVEEFWRDHACYECIAETEFTDEAVADAVFAAEGKFDSIRRSWQSSSTGSGRPRSPLLSSMTGFASPATLKNSAFPLATCITMPMRAMTSTRPPMTACVRTAIGSSPSKRRATAEFVPICHLTRNRFGDRRGGCTESGKDASSFDE